MNFPQAYRDYIQNTESHENYHLWSAVYATSVLLGKKCFVDRGTYILHPNLYVIIVGEAAARKSSAMRVAQNLVKSVGDICIAPTSSSREALIDYMGENPIECVENNEKYIYHQVAVFANEFDTFLGGTHLNKSLVTFLTDIWDASEYTDRTRKGGLVTISSPYLTLIGCCVPAFFEQSVKTDIITGGFTRRGIFVYEDRNQKLIAWPQLTQAQEEAWEVMEKEARRIRAIKGSFAFTKEAVELFTKWYIEADAKNKSADEKLRSYYASRYDLLIKVAMCLSAFYDSSKIIDTSILILADKMLASTEKRLDKLFRGVGRNELNGISQRIVDFLKKETPKGSVPKGVIYKQFYSEAKVSEIDEILNMLVASGIAELILKSINDSGSYSVRETLSPYKEEHLFEQVCLREACSGEHLLGYSPCSQQRGLTQASKLPPKKQAPEQSPKKTGLAAQLLADEQARRAKKLEKVKESSQI